MGMKGLQFVNSPHNFNEMLVRQVLRMKNIISLSQRCDFDVTPNSHDYPRKKAKVQVRRMNFSIVGMKGLKHSNENRLILFTFLSLFTSCFLSFFSSFVSSLDLIELWAMHVCSVFASSTAPPSPPFKVLLTPPWEKTPSGIPSLDNLIGLTYKEKKTCVFLIVGVGVR